MVDVGKNLSPVPFPSQGKGEKEERGLCPLSKNTFPLSFEGFVSKVVSSVSP